MPIATQRVLCLRARLVVVVLKGSHKKKPTILGRVPLTQPHAHNCKRSAQVRLIDLIHSDNFLPGFSEPSMSEPRS